MIMETTFADDRGAGLAPHADAASVTETGSTEAACGAQGRREGAARERGPDDGTARPPARPSADWPFT